MCNCSELPNCVAEIGYWERSFVFSGSSINARYFETPDSEHFEPPLDYSQSMYRCAECGQPWYIEGTPEEYPSSIFALKASEITLPPSDEQVKAAKNYLCILAHGGFSSEKCSSMSCQNYKLLGRELCHLHITFP